MEATVAERGQITLPKAARDALGLTKGTKLKIEIDNGRLIIRKDVSDALSRLRGRFKLDGFANTDEAMRAIRGRAHRALDVDDPPAGAADQMVVVVADPILEAGR